MSADPGELEKMFNVSKSKTKDVYDCTADVNQHIERVQWWMYWHVDVINWRSKHHDESKLLQFQDDEKQIIYSVGMRPNILIPRKNINGEPALVFYTEDDENTVEADSKGNFTGSVRLAEGINTLVVTAFSDDGQEKSISLNVINDTQID